MESDQRPEGSGVESAITLDEEPEEVIATKCRHPSKVPWLMESEIKMVLSMADKGIYRDMFFGPSDSGSDRLAINLADMARAILIKDLLSTVGPALAAT